VNRLQSSLHLTDYRQRIRPPDAAQTDFKAVGIGPADLSELIRVPAEREAHARDNHRDRCKWTKQKISVSFVARQREKL
jgi:hypothetical protein